MESNLRFGVGEPVCKLFDGDQITLPRQSEQLAVMVNVGKYTSGVGVAATRREETAKIDAVRAVNRMFAILTLSFIHVGFYPVSIHALIAHCHINSAEHGIVSTI